MKMKGNCETCLSEIIKYKFEKIRESIMQIDIADIDKSIKRKKMIPK